MKLTIIKYNKDYPQAIELKGLNKEITNNIKQELKNTHTKVPYEIMNEKENSDIPKPHYIMYKYIGYTKTNNNTLKSARNYGIYYYNTNKKMIEAIKEFLE